MLFQIPILTTFVRYFNNRKSNLSFGERIKPSVFRFDISHFMKQYFCLFLFVIVLQSCKKEPGNDNRTAVTMMNVSYGSDAKQTMDVYLPAGRSVDTTKVIVLIHGGGWTEGDKADFTPFVEVIQQLLPGYAIFNINYRLAYNGSNIFPTQENDVKAAIEFIYSKRSGYHISDKFVYLGASAGGHLSLLQAYKYHSPVTPKAVISFFGPTDLTALFGSNLWAALILAQLTGSLPATNPAIYQQSSPITFVNASSPPTLLLHGGADPLVPSSQADLLKDALTNTGVANQYVFYPNEAHGWTGANLDDSIAKIVAFLRNHVN